MHTVSSNSVFDFTIASPMQPIAMRMKRNRTLRAFCFIPPSLLLLSTPLLVFPFLVALRINNQYKDYVRFGERLERSGFLRFLLYVTSYLRGYV